MERALNGPLTPSQLCDVDNDNNEGQLEFLVCNGLRFTDTHVGKYVPLNSVCSKIVSIPPNAAMTSTL